jgi:hypothetical protein
MWKFEGPEAFACMPLVLLKFAYCVIADEIHTRLTSLDFFACNVVVLCQSMWLYCAWCRYVIFSILSRVSLYIWIVCNLWDLTLESVESFACTPLVVFKLVWIWSTYLFLSVGIILATIGSLVFCAVTRVGGGLGWFEYLLIATNVLLETCPWTCAFKTCCILGVWLWFRQWLWACKVRNGFVRAQNAPIMMANTIQMQIAEATDAVARTKAMAAELSSTIEQHVEAQWWTGRSVRCLVVLALAFLLSYISSYSLKLPWNQHVATATEVQCCAILSKKIVNVGLMYLCLRPGV